MGGSGGIFRLARAMALAAMLASVAIEIDARGFRGGGGGRIGGGGGIRGGGSTSIDRGGGSYSRGSFDRGSDSYRGGSTFSREGSYSKPSSLDRKPSSLDSPRRSSGTDWNSMTKRPGGGASASQLPAERPGRGGSASQLPANRPIDGMGVRPPANRPDNGGSGTRWRPDCPKCNDGWDGWVDHPIAAGIAIGAIAGAAATIGSAWYSLPYDCPPYYWDGTYYYSCDGNWYQPHYEGDTIVYITIPDPSDGKAPPAE